VPGVDFDEAKDITDLVTLFSFLFQVCGYDCFSNSGSPGEQDLHGSAV
jgi:hypothetical protein